MDITPESIAFDKAVKNVGEEKVKSCIRKFNTNPLYTLSDLSEDIKLQLFDALKLVRKDEDYISPSVSASALFEISYAKLKEFPSEQEKSMDSDQDVQSFISHIDSVWSSTIKIIKRIINENKERSIFALEAVEFLCTKLVSYIRNLFVETHKLTNSLAKFIVDIISLAKDTLIFLLSKWGINYGR